MAQGQGQATGRCCRVWLPSIVLPAGDRLKAALEGVNGANFEHLARKHPGSAFRVFGAASPSLPPWKRLQVVAQCQNVVDLDKVEADVVDLAETACDIVADGLGLSDEQVQQAFEEIRVERSEIKLAQVKAGSPAAPGTGGQVSLAVASQLGIASKAGIPAAAKKMPSQRHAERQAAAVSGIPAKPRPLVPASLSLGPAGGAPLGLAPPAPGLAALGHPNRTSAEMPPPALPPAKKRKKDKPTAMGEALPTAPGLPTAPAAAGRPVASGSAGSAGIFSPSDRGSVAQGLPTAAAAAGRPVASGLAGSAGTAPRVAAAPAAVPPAPAPPAVPAVPAAPSTVRLAAAPAALIPQAAAQKLQQVRPHSLKELSDRVQEEARAGELAALAAAKAALARQQLERARLGQAPAAPAPGPASAASVAAAAAPSGQPQEIEDSEGSSDESADEEGEEEEDASASDEEEDEEPEAGVPSSGSTAVVPGTAAAGSLAAFAPVKVRLSKLGEFCCDVFACFAGGNPTPQMLQPKLSIDQRAKLDRCKEHLDFAGDLVTVWRLTTTTKRHIDGMSALCDYFVSKQRVGMVTVADYSVYMVPPDSTFLTALGLAAKGYDQPGCLLALQVPADTEDGEEEQDADIVGGASADPS